jgi:hypothetical protein
MLRRGVLPSRKRKSKKVCYSEEAFLRGVISGSAGLSLSLAYERNLERTGRSLPVTQTLPPVRAAD